LDSFFWDEVRPALLAASREVFPDEDELRALAFGLLSCFLEVPPPHLRLASMLRRLIFCKTVLDDEISSKLEDLRATFAGMTLGVDGLLESDRIDRTALCFRPPFSRRLDARRGIPSQADRLRSGGEDRGDGL